MFGKYPEPGEGFGPYAYDDEVLREEKLRWYGGVARSEAAENRELSVGQTPDAQYYHDQGIHYHELGQIQWPDWVPDFVKNMSPFQLSIAAGLGAYLVWYMTSTRRRY